MAGENLPGKENADAKTREPVDPFEVMDEVQKEGYTLADVADETDAEIAEEENDGEGTGLKYFAAEERRKNKKENDEDEDEGEETAEERGETEAEESDEKEETSEKEEEIDEETEEDDESEEEEEEDEKEPKNDHPDWLVEKLKNINPDLDTDDEEAVQKAVDDLAAFKDEAEQAKQDLEEEIKANDEFRKLVGGNDDLKGVIKFMFKHDVTMPTALAALDIKTGVDMEKLKKEDPDAYLELKNAQEAREKQEKQAEEKRKERAKTLKDNQKKSEKNATEFKEEVGIDSKEYDKIADAVNPEMENISNGLVTKNFLKLIYDGVTAEERIAAAKEEGLKEGKNMKVDEIMSRKDGDNLPKIDPGPTETAEEEKRDIWSEALHEETRISELEKR